jgi:hypothetical protein
MYSINPLRRSARLAAMAIQPSVIVEPIVNDESHLEKATKKARAPTPTRSMTKEEQKSKRREKDRIEREERKVEDRKTRRQLFIVSISCLVGSVLCVGGVVAIAATCPWWAGVVAGVVGAAAVCGLLYVGARATLMAGHVFEH